MKRKTPPGGPGGACYVCLLDWFYGVGTVAIVCRIRLAIL